MGSAIRFGIGKMEVGATAGVTGLQFGELQDATISISGDLKDIWGDGGKYASCGQQGHRTIEVKAKYAKIGAEDLNRVLGGTWTAGGTATMHADDVMPFFRLVLKNPSDGSDITVTFPKVKSTGNLEMVMVQDDFMILEPSFRAYKYGADQEVMSITFGDGTC